MNMVTTVEVIYATYVAPAGYYIVGDDCELIGLALCSSCAIDGELRINAHADVTDLDRHEPIGYWHETDAPVHCDCCNALLVTTLTRDGREYVASALAAETGLPAVLAAWRDAFADEMKSDGHCVECGDARDLRDLAELTDASTGMRCGSCLSVLFA